MNIFKNIKSQKTLKNIARHAWGAWGRVFESHRPDQ